MRRRDFIAALGGAAALVPRIARAQQSRKNVRIGVFGASLSSPIAAAPYAVFLDEMQKAGYRNDQNLSVEYRLIDQPGSDLQTLASEVIRSRVDVFLVTGPLAGLRAVMATGPDVPIVILAINYDPIEHGYVKSLSRPGGLVTGVVMRQTELAEKQVELLTQVVPGKTRLAILWDAFSVDQFKRPVAGLRRLACKWGRSSLKIRLTTLRRHSGRWPPLSRKCCSSCRVSISGPMPVASPR